MTETVPHVVLRDASGPYAHRYAAAGEKTYCAKGHLLGHFVKDAYVGAIPAGEIVAIAPMQFGAAACPHCGAPVGAGAGLYYFEFTP